MGMMDNAKTGLINSIKNLLGRGSHDDIGGADGISPVKGGNTTEIGKHGDDGRGPGGDGTGTGDYYYKKMIIERTRKASYIDYDLMDAEHPELSCITGDTIVHCLDGDFTIRDLAENRADETFWVYSSDGNKIVIDTAYAPRLTYRKVPLLRVRYRSNNRWPHELKVTPDHKFMLRDGSMRMAQDLKCGDSLMPFNAWYAKGRRIVKDSDGRKLFASHLVFEQIAGRKIAKGNVAHHKDENKQNDIPVNLEEMDKAEHSRMHSTGNNYSLGVIWAHDDERVENHKQRMFGNDYKKDKPNSPEARKKMKKAHARRRELGLKRDRVYGEPWNRKHITKEALIEAVEMTVNYKEAAAVLNISTAVFFRRVKKFNLKDEIDYNHTVVGIEDGGIDDVYDLTTARTHKFAANHIIISNSSLDVYADNCVAGEEPEEQRFAIDSEDEKVKEVLTDINKRTRIDQELWPLTRDLCKYGDEFEDTATEKVLAKFEPWQIAHFRNRTSRKGQYGTSIFSPARRLFKQLQMMEDGMVIGRLSRSHMRYVYKIDVGEMAPAEAEAHVESVKRRIKKKRRLNPLTGKFDVISNPMSAEEDMFVGVRNGSPAGVDTLEGTSRLSLIKDVEYFQNKMFTIVKVPKSWLGLERDVNAKATLSGQEVQFARTIRRIQHVSLKNGLKKIYDIGLLLQGYDLTKVQYEILFPAIKTIDEVRKWQIEKSKAEVAKIYGVDMGVLTDEFILSHFLNLTDEEIKGLNVDKEKESEKAKKAAEAEIAAKIKIAQAASAVVPQQKESTVGFMHVLNELRDVVAMELEDKKYRKLTGQ
jgi:intein/homing endonuclease